MGSSWRVAQPQPQPHWGWHADQAPLTVGGAGEWHAADGDPSQQLLQVAEVEGQEGGVVVLGGQHLDATCMGGRGGTGCLAWLERCFRA